MLLTVVKWSTLDRLSHSWKVHAPLLQNVFGINSILILHYSLDLLEKFDVAVVSMASTSSFAPPKLADFILTERLGSGTYATVYKAYRKVSLWRDQGKHHRSPSELKVCLRWPPSLFTILHKL